MCKTTSKNNRTLEEVVFLTLMMVKLAQITTSVLQDAASLQWDKQSALVDHFSLRIRIIVSPNRMYKLKEN